MKIYIISFFVIISSLSILAQAPHQFNYQAVVRNSNGEIMANADVDMQIEILSNAVDGEIVFNELHAVTTSNYGLANLVIGSLNDMSAINWHEAPHFIRITVNGTVMGTTQLLSVPYAIQSKQTENLDSAVLHSPDGSQWRITVSNSGQLATELVESNATEITDYDGNVYTPVTIGTQTWLYENLKTTHDNNGNEITVYAPDGNAANVDEYGYLYQWETLSNVCPEGFHVPTIDEWVTLIDFAGGTETAGEELQPGGSTGFDAKLAGKLMEDESSYLGFGSSAYFWSSTDYNGSEAYGVVMSNTYSGAYTDAGTYNYGFSVRCVGD